MKKNLRNFCKKVLLGNYKHISILSKVLQLRFISSPLFNMKFLEFSIIQCKQIRYFFFLTESKAFCWFDTLKRVRIPSCSYIAKNSQFKNTTNNTNSTPKNAGIIGIVLPPKSCAVGAQELWKVLHLTEKIHFEMVVNEKEEMWN